MRGRFRSLAITFRNAPGRLHLVPLLVIPTVLTGWIVGVLILPEPDNWLTRCGSLLAAAGGLAALAGTYVDALSMRHKYPPLIVVGGSVCLLSSAFCLFTEPSWVLAFRLVLPLIFTGLVWFYTFYFSVFHGAQRVSRLKVGESFPAFALADSESRVQTLTSVLAEGPVLLLFYKGDW